MCEELSTIKKQIIEEKQMAQLTSSMIITLKSDLSKQLETVTSSLPLIESLSKEFGDNYADRDSYKTSTVTASKEEMKNHREINTISSQRIQKADNSIINGSNLEGKVENISEQALSFGHPCFIHKNENSEKYWFLLAEEGIIKISKTSDFKEITQYKLKAAIKLTYAEVMPLLEIRRVCTNE